MYELYCQYNDFEIIHSWLTDRNGLLSAHLSSKGEENIEVILPSFKDALDCIDTFRVFFVSNNTNENFFRNITSYNALHKSQNKSEC